VGVFASKISQIDYTTIEKSSSNIIIGKVVSTTENLPKGVCSSFMYDANIQIVTELKGIAGVKQFILPVCNGHKGFNRGLTVGKNYIYFLVKGKDTFRRVYPIGSVGEF